MNLSLNTMMAAIASALACSAALGQHGGDVYLEQDYLGRICTGEIDDETGEVTHNTRVFGAEFGESPNFTNDPGFDSAIDAFTPGSTIGFTIRRALRAWDGADFDTIPAEQIRVKLGNLGPVLSPTDDTPVTGFALQVGSEGEFHHHLGYTLTDPAQPGIYLLELELWSGDGSLGTSRPFWIVFNQLDSEENHEAATEWVRANLAGCPSDFDASGFTDTDDFDAFVRAYEAGDFTADVDRTGFVDTDDFDFFVLAYEAGC
ncbi:MAG: hypothetical protein AMXMBFR58_08090 [Phycisphaerae bacterium]